jgi:hypothetical protein
MVNIRLMRINDRPSPKKPIAPSKKRSHIPENVDLRSYGHDFDMNFHS